MIMDDIKVIGLDLAKNVCYVHGVNKVGKTVLKKKLSRNQLLPFFANLKPCLVGMETGSACHYWAREIKKLGHDTKVMAAQFVKPYLKNDKTDANDAEAICEAVTRPNMRFVGAKTVDQQDIQSVHRIRERLVQSRTALACEIRGFLAEYGIILPVGIREIKRKLPDILIDEENDLTTFTREIFENLLIELNELSSRINKYNCYIRRILKESEIAQKLMTIPGVGELSATAIIASVADPKMFKSGRQFAAYLGLVPKQRSSGGKVQYMGISKRGNKYIRKMLIHGARVVVSHSDKYAHRLPKKCKWISQLRERRGYCKTTVALANKNARICWALMMKNENYVAAI
jgi:transposase